MMNTTIIISAISAMLIIAFRLLRRKTERKKAIWKSVPKTKKDNVIIKAVKSVDATIRGNDTRIEGEPVQILSSWVAEVYDGYGQLFKRAPVRIGRNRRFTIGSHPNNDLTISEACPGAEFVGKFHAYLMEDEEELYFNDNESENGTYDAVKERTSWSDIQDKSEFWLAGIIRIRFLKTSPAEYFRMTRKQDVKTETREFLKHEEYGSKAGTDTFKVPEVQPAEQKTRIKTKVYQH